MSQPEIVRLEEKGFSETAGGFNPPEFTSPSGNDYCLDVQAQDGTLLAQHCFDISFADLETGLPNDSSPFFLTLPNPEGNDIGQISINKNNVALAVSTPSNTPPEVAITFPNGAEVLRNQQTISWEGHDADGDSLLYDVLYSADGGQSWLPLATRWGHDERSCCAQS